LVGDVGGTKTDLAIVSEGGDPRSRLAQKRYGSHAYPGLEAMARDLLKEADLRVDAACFDVAGPVTGGEAWLTNLSWHLKEADLAESLGIDRVWLLNDLVATASAVPVLRPDELATVKEGRPLRGGAIAVLAPGTGLGEAFLTHDGVAYRAHPSEGGHSSYAPADQLELELLSHLWQSTEHVSFERVASGIGMPNLYRFLRDRRAIGESPILAKAVSGTDDQTRVIVEAALDPSRPDPLALATLDLFAHILGGEAANLALKVLATGGIYLAGGIAQRLGRFLPGSRFTEGLMRSGRFRSLLEQIPVYLVKGDLALIGVAVEGLRRLALVDTPSGPESGA
jgi:glucokinase